jgi:Alw26I/Eco31I/Esp3I family type II restriction m6 adenine DNA methyltransferase
MKPSPTRPSARQGVLFTDSDPVRSDPYPLAVPAVAEPPAAAAPVDWRARERLRQNLAQELHRAAAIDLASAPTLWSFLPHDGPVDDLLSLRHSSEVPSIRLSRTAAIIAVWSCVAEMARRRNAVGWTGASLAPLISIWAGALPELAAPWLETFAHDLPVLRQMSAALEKLVDPELARVAGRTYEFGLTTLWLFRSPTADPERLWHIWRAKQSGCFFTPEFIARHLAATAVTESSTCVLDPAVGGAAFLIEAYLRLSELGVKAPANRLYGVDLDGRLADFSALIVEFLSGTPLTARLSSRGRFRGGDSLLTAVNRPSASATWAEWFPDVIGGGGFDAILMNPPYLQLKVNHSSLPARAGDTEEAELLRLLGVEQARTNARELSERLRAHPDFRYAHGGVPDLPRFFVERALALLRPGGRLACIVPSTFLADHRSKGVRRHLLKDHTLRELDLIPEDARLFADVNQPTCLLVADKGQSARRSRVRIRTGISSPASLRASRSILIAPQLLHTVDPEHLRVPACEPEDWDILALLHQHPSIAEHDWVENLRGELDLTLDRRFISDAPTGLPLVRGDQIERFTSSLESDKPRWVGAAFLRESISHRKLQHIERLRVVGRQCSYLKKPRRLSFSLIDGPAVVSNSCNYLVVRADDPNGLSRFLVGALNSAILEWRFRLTSSTNHVGNYEIDALPLPVPSKGFVAEVGRLVDRLLRNPRDAEADRELDDLWFEAYGLGLDAQQRITSALPTSVGR